MKLTRLLIAGLLAAVSPVHASDKPEPAYQLPLVSKSVLTDVVRLASGHLIAVGERGHIIQSTDGTNWQQTQVPVQANLNSVYFVDDTYGWAVGHDATILATTDGGQSWKLQQFRPELDKPLFDVFFKDRLNGFAVGAYGLFYTTQDGGESWRQVWHASFANAEDSEFLAELKETEPDSYEQELASVLPHLNRLVVRNQTIYLVGEAGFWATSQDFGVSWQRQPEFYNGSLFAIEQTANGTLIAAGLRGHVFRSTDLGQQWHAVPLSSPATLNSVQVNGTEVWLFGNSGAIFHSSDDGVSFNLVPQTSGKAVLNGVVQGQDLLLVTETGIKTIQQKVAR